MPVESSEVVSMDNMIPGPSRVDHEPSLGALDEIVEAPVVYPGTFVLVRFPMKKSIRFYVAIITSHDDGFYNVKYLRKNKEEDYFFYPISDDLDTIEATSIEQVLPDPQSKNGKQQFSFGSVTFPEGTW